MSKKVQILLTNDDGIQSPGLWAAAEALSELGYVSVVAPRDQFSGAGRSLPGFSDGIIHPRSMKVHDQEWTVYAVGGSPAQAVLHAVLEIIPRKPDLVVAGINYGGNFGTGVTTSGTVGAAMEGASHGIPALAISLDTEDRLHLSYSHEVDFTAAAHFTRFFARLILESQMPQDVDVLKVEVPAAASTETPWEITRLARKRYYENFPPERESWEQPGRIGYRQASEPHQFPEDSDVYAVTVKGVVSVTPLSLDLTSRVDLESLNDRLRGPADEA